MPMPVDIRAKVTPPPPAETKGLVLIAQGLGLAPPGGIRCKQITGTDAVAWALSQCLANSSAFAALGIPVPVILPGEGLKALNNLHQLADPTSTRELAEGLSARLRSLPPGRSKDLQELFRRIGPPPQGLPAPHGNAALDRKKWVREARQTLNTATDLPSLDFSEAVAATQLSMLAEIAKEVEKGSPLAQAATTVEESIRRHVESVIAALRESVAAATPSLEAMGSLQTIAGELPARTFVVDLAPGLLLEDALIRHEAELVDALSDTEVPFADVIALSVQLLDDPNAFQTLIEKAGTQVFVWSGVSGDTTDLLARSAAWSRPTGLAASRSAVFAGSVGGHSVAVEAAGLRLRLDRQLRIRNAADDELGEMALMTGQRVPGVPRNSLSTADLLPSAARALEQCGVNTLLVRDGEIVIGSARTRSGSPNRAFLELSRFEAIKTGQVASYLRAASASLFNETALRNYHASEAAKRYLDPYRSPLLTAAIRTDVGGHAGLFRVDLSFQFHHPVTAIELTTDLQVL